MYCVIQISSSPPKKFFFPPKMAMMKISASRPPWDGRPAEGVVSDGHCGGHLDGWVRLSGQEVSAELVSVADNQVVGVVVYVTHRVNFQSSCLVWLE